MPVYIIYHLRNHCNHAYYSTHNSTLISVASDCSHGLIIPTACSAQNSRVILGNLTHLCRAQCKFVYYYSSLPLYGLSISFSLSLSLLFLLTLSNTLLPYHNNAECCSAQHCYYHSHLPTTKTAPINITANNPLHSLLSLLSILSLSLSLSIYPSS